MGKYLKAVCIGLILLSNLSFGQSTPDEIRLEIKPHYGNEAIAVVKLLDIYHFKDIRFDDSLSAIVLDNYIEGLDQNKHYFLESDIQYFHSQYRHKLDDLTSEGDVNPAFNIYAVFEQRFKERMTYVYDHLMSQDFDFTLDEVYNTDREKEAWAKNISDLNDIWRKVVKSQALGLKLNGKTKEEIEKTITERYDRLKKSMLQYRNDDLFQLYMNVVAEAYDPHTNYFSPATSERFRQNMSLSLEGIGARLVNDNDYTRVVEIIPGGPAFKSKLIHPDDRIIGVAQGKESEDFEDVVGWRLDDVVKLIKGPKGTWVRLQLLPAETGLNGTPVVISLLREKIKLEDQAATKEVYNIKKDGKDYKLGVISIPLFYMDFEAYQNGDPNYTSTSRDVKKLTEALKVENVDGLMIDLRNNGGGSLKEAIELTGLFITDGPVVQVKNVSDKVEVGEDEDPEIVWDGPLTVLINRFSASASEIFAGAIQDYGRGVIIGEQTYGKGTVQSMVDLKRFLPEEEAELGHLKLTLQKFYRVTGSSTQHLGVTPDVPLPSAFSAEEFGESSEPSALPWDQIKGTKYKSFGVINADLLAELNNHYQLRLQSDPVLNALTKEVGELKESMSKTVISLNEKVRMEERKANEAALLRNQGLSGKVIPEGDDDDKDNVIDVEDKILREGIIILSEIVKHATG